MLASLGAVSAARALRSVRWSSAPEAVRSARWLVVGAFAAPLFAAALAIPAVALLFWLVGDGSPGGAGGVLSPDPAIVVGCAALAGVAPSLAALDAVAWFVRLGAAEPPVTWDP